MNLGYWIFKEKLRARNRKINGNHNVWRHCVHSFATWGSVHMESSIPPLTTQFTVTTIYEFIAFETITITFPLPLPFTSSSFLSFMLLPSPFHTVPLPYSFFFFSCCSHRTSRVIIILLRDERSAMHLNWLCSLWTLYHEAILCIYKYITKDGTSDVPPEFQLLFSLFLNG